MADGEGASELSVEREGAVAPRQHDPEKWTPFFRKDHAQTKEEKMETFDYVIIGAGSAGSVLANRLGEDLGTKICVLEAGPSDWHPYIHLPAGFIKTFHMKSVNWAYQQEPGPWTGGRSIYSPPGQKTRGSPPLKRPIYKHRQRQEFHTPAQPRQRGRGDSDPVACF